MDTNQDEPVNHNVILELFWSYYFVTVTFSTVGYGDISPMNDVEITLCIVFQLVNYIFVTIFVAELGPVIEEFGFRHLSRARQHRMLKHCFDCIHLDVKEQVSYISDSFLVM